MIFQTKSNKLKLRKPFIFRFTLDIKKNPALYLMLIPVLAFYIIFYYQPMYGAIIAFKDYQPAFGIGGSPWVGLKYFKEFFESYYFQRLITNTFLMSLYNILFGFPAPIILALLLNEVRSAKFKRTVQTVTYLPHFISTVVICGIILDFFSRDGVINQLVSFLGIESRPFMIMPEWFRTIYVGSNIWQEIGWGSIIYLAALTSIDQEQYEACRIDGGGRFRQMLSVTLPGLAPTIIILLILRVGSMMSIGHEKILLLYNARTFETADVISTFVYRKGLIDMSFSYSSAIGLFNSAINLILLTTVNWISRKFSETSLM